MKASIAAASAAILGCVAASHNAHAGFHDRRGAEYGSSPEEDMCITYTETVTVYEQPTLPAVVPNSTVVVYPSPVEPEPTTTVTIHTTRTDYIYIHPSEAPSETCIEEPTSTITIDTTTTISVPAQEYSVYSPPASSSSPAYVAAPPQSSKPVVSAQAYTSVGYSAPAPSSSVVASSVASYASPPSQTGSYASGGRIVTNGNKWAMTYTPYAANGNCRDNATIWADIASISSLGFTTIRAYSTDCGVFESVVPACQAHGLKIIFGIFFDKGGEAGKGPFSQYANEQLEDIKCNAPHDIIAMIIVGNEAIFNGYTNATELVSYIDYTRTTLQSAGFPKDIAITTTEPVDIFQANGAALCDHIDIVTVQVHPYFTDKVVASSAGHFAKEQLDLAITVCPAAAARGAWISEIGWPNAGDANGAAVASPETQSAAILNIIEVVGSDAVLFSFSDDEWKAPGSLNVEQHFGCADVIKTEK